MRISQYWRTSASTLVVADAGSHIEEDSDTLVLANLKGNQYTWIKRCVRHTVALNHWTRKLSAKQLKFWIWSSQISADGDTIQRTVKKSATWP